MKDGGENTVWVRFKPAKHHAFFDGELAFSRMSAAYEQILEKHDDKIVESVYTFAGQAARIRSLGAGVARHINRPFDHLRNGNGKMITPGLKIDLWDQEETAILCPVDSVAPSLRSSSEHGFVVGSPQDRFIGCYSAQIVTWFDRASQRLIGCVSSSRQLSVYEQGKPFHFPLLVWHSDQDVPVIHAGLVSYDDQGVLLVGRGGTGKSTVALACLGAGFHYVGDDYVGLKASSDGLLAGHSLYNTTWLEPSHMTRFPVLVPRAIEGDRRKLPVLLSQVFPEKLARLAPIRLLLLPRLTDHPLARALPASKREALLALTPTSMIKMPVSGRRHLDRIFELIKSVPCYWLEFGDDLRYVPSIVKELLLRSGHP